MKILKHTHTHTPKNNKKTTTTKHTHVLTHTHMTVTWCCCVQQAITILCLPPVAGHCHPPSHTTLSLKITPAPPTLPATVAPQSTSTNCTVAMRRCARKLRTPRTFSAQGWNALHQNCMEVLIDDWLMIAYITLFSALLSWLITLACCSTWMISFIVRFLSIHRSGVLTALTWLVWHETAAISVQVLCTPYNHAPCHFMQSHIHKVYACLAVTCHLHFVTFGRMTRIFYILLR